jgi:hypothetical protein
MPLTRIKSLGITDGTITAADFASGVGGKVLQVVTATDGTQRSTTSTSFVTGSNTLSITITPSSTSSKIFITMSTAGLRGSGATGSAHYTIFRNGSTNLGDATAGMSLYYSSESSNDWGFPLAMSITDSPSTTSATTYQVYMKTTNASNTVRLQQYPVLGTITAFEIAS